MNTARRRSPGAAVLVVFGCLLPLLFSSYVAQWAGYFLVLVVLLSYLYTVVVRGGLSIRRAAKDLVIYRYENGTVSVEISNRSILPVPELTVHDNPGTLYSGYENARLVSLRPGETSTLVYRIRGMNRGRYPIGPITVRFSDPLGLFPVDAVVNEKVSLFVYPTIHPVDTRMTSGLPAGTITATSRIYEDPTRYRSVRDYMPGDEQRRINWKVSARSGRLHSNEWLPTISSPVLCLLNLTAADYERRHRYQHVERTIDATASLVHSFASRGQSVGLVSSGVLESEGSLVMPWIPVASGMQHAKGILQALAEIQPNTGGTEDTPQPDIATLLLENGSVSFGTRVFYLGPPLTPERVLTLLSGLAQRSMLRLHYTDEMVADWRALAVESVEMCRITESGHELFDTQI